MLMQYCQEALNHAHDDIIEDTFPYYGEIPELPGVWATGKSLEECRRNLASALEDWLFISVAKGLPIPTIGECSLPKPERLAAYNDSPRPCHAARFYPQNAFLGL